MIEHIRNSSAPPNVAIPLDERCHAGLAALLRAYEYARDAAADPWDFALQVDALYETGMTISDLRWLVAKRFSEHGQETSVYGAPHRVFRRGSGFVIDGSTCMVLTPDGAGMAAKVLNDPAIFPPRLQPELPAKQPALPRATGLSKTRKPNWDLARRELSVAGTVVKRFRVPAQNQELILCSFEEEGWPYQIHDPLPNLGNIDTHIRLHDTINRLNGCQKTPLIRFHGNGTGDGIAWELRNSNPLRPQKGLATN